MSKTGQRGIPPAKRLWQDPSLRLKAVPWPTDAVVFVDMDGSWWPSVEGRYEGMCPSCRGGYDVRGGRPKFCPWCGRSLEAAPQANFIAEE
jgi:hypothetical protein